MKKRNGELQKIGSLFDIYKDRLKAPQKTVIDVVVEVVKDVTGIALDPHRCSYTVSTKTLATNAPSMIQQEIQMHHDEIMVHVRGRLGDSSTPVRII